MLLQKDKAKLLITNTERGNTRMLMADASGEFSIVVNEVKTSVRRSKSNIQKRIQDELVGITSCQTALVLWNYTIFVTRLMV